jgi:hypothetical protein
VHSLAPAVLHSDFYRYEHRLKLNVSLLYQYTPNNII